MIPRFLAKPAALLLSTAALLFPFLPLKTQTRSNAPQDTLLTKVNYWHVPEYNLVMRSSPCAQTVCLDIYGVDNSNAALKDIFDGGWIDNMIAGKINEIMQRPDRARINSPQSMCTARFNGTLQQQGLTWNTTAGGIRMSMTTDDGKNLQVQFRSSFISKEIKAQRIGKPSAALRGACAL